LEEYEKIVYIDADAYVLKNVDELFEYPKGGRLIAAAPGKTKTESRTYS